MTLYVMTENAYAHLESATLRIDVEQEKNLQMPLHHLGGLVCFGNVMISPALMHRLADEGKSLVLLNASGRFKARLEGPVSGNILLRQAHHRVASEPAFTLEFARAVFAGKLKNPLSETKMPIGLIPFIQARFMARTIRGEMEGYLPFLTK